MNDLTKQETALAAQSDFSIGDMLKAVSEGGITPDKVTVIERILALKERTDAKNAERTFATALAKLQSELPIIVAQTDIPNRGKYERFEDIMKVITEPVARNGFSISFSMDFKENRILETCTLTHVCGHSRSNSFAVRTGGRSDSETQADCKAATTAKRLALCNALNIVIRQDVDTSEHDARIEGGTITREESEDIRRRVVALKINVEAFLKWAQADSFANIRQGHYQKIIAHLTKKEMGAK